MKTTVVLALCATLSFAAASFADVQVRNRDARGVPSWVAGDLGPGRTDHGRAAASAIDALRRNGHLFGAIGSESFDVVGSELDELGSRHVRVRERLKGLPVIGADLVVHTNAKGRVYAINGTFVPDRGLPRKAAVDGAEAVVEAAAQLGLREWEPLSAPELVYVVEQGKTYLAWRVRASWEGENGPEIDDLFADALTGDLVARHPLVKRARNRRTYTANNGTSLPGSLVLTETTGSTSDVAVNAAHTNAGKTYDFYAGVFSRDSYDGNGATLYSTAHFDRNYNNAYWDGSQMVYGDGDGSSFIELSRAFDVVAHELTHAVTERTANLTYARESGALNEAWSDIMAAAAEAWDDATITANTWKVGEDIYTPGTAGDALRYMDNPTADGYSKDYYPERLYATCSVPSNSNDQCGVHGNSGIANLAFKLLVTGGTHPRSKTTVNVTSLGMTQARAIFYRALANYMTSSTNFEGARTATAQAATDLYGSAANAAVHLAWDAVGVPGGSGGGGGGGTTTLQNGVPVTGLSGATGSTQTFTLAVPSGQSSLVFQMSGGSGDADLYVKLGSAPTTSSYDCRPYLNGNSESCSFDNPASGTWYAMVRAYSSYSGVSLTGTYTGGTGGGGGGTCGGTTYTGSVSSRGNSYQPNGSYYYSSTSGAHTGILDGPSGTDFDLYLQKWNGSSWSTVKSSTSASSHEEISYSGSSGYYRWRIYAYSGSGSYSLCTTRP